MDSFAESNPPPEIPLEDIREQILQQQADLTAKGIKLSGRVLHICHYLPVVPSLARSPAKGNLPSPPQTPPTKSPAVDGLTIQPEAAPVSLPTAENPDEASGWSLSVRYGHGAMISGIRSLEAPSEQLIVGWTGDIQNSNQPETTVPLGNISDEDRSALEKSLKTYQPREADPDDDRKTTYIPVWVDEKEAHGHYEGYCKESTFWPIHSADRAYVRDHVVQRCGPCSITSSGRMRPPNTRLQTSTGPPTPRRMPSLQRE